MDLSDVGEQPDRWLDVRIRPSEESDLREFIPRHLAEVLHVELVDDVVGRDLSDQINTGKPLNYNQLTQIAGLVSTVMLISQSEL